MNRSTIKIKKEGDILKVSVDVPKNFKLYRFRSDSELNFNSFMNDEIWGTEPRSFNDPYDTMFIYKIKNLYEYAKKRISDDKKLCEVLCNQNGVKNDNMAPSKLSRLLVDSMIQGDNHINRVTVAACFTERIDNELMWAHYANNAKGFALEYDYEELKQFGKEVDETNNKLMMEEYNFLNLKDNYRKPRTLIPMIYRNTKYDSTHFIELLIDCELERVRKVLIENKNITFEDYINDYYNISKEVNKNDEFFWKMNSLKKVEWKYEHEWRLLADNLNVLKLDKSPHFRIGHLKPKAIYLGEKMTDYNKKVLLLIAKEKGIKIYQMSSKVFRDTMKLVYKEIRDL